MGCDKSECVHADEEVSFGERGKKLWKMLNKS